MLIHHYDNQTGQYCGSQLADADPRSPGRWLLPAFSTAQVLPERTAESWPFFRDGEWVLLPDFRGKVLYRTDTGEQAEIVAANGIRRHPQYVGGYVALGRILMEQSRFAEAGPILQKATDLDPENLLALQLLGTYYLQTQRPKDALKAFKRVLFLNPQSEKARNAVQKLESISADEYEDDMFQYQTLKTQPISPQANSKETVSSTELERKLSLVDALIVRNDLEKARMHLEELNARLPNHKEIVKRFELLDEALPEEEAMPLHPVASREKMVIEKKRRILENLLRRIKAHTEDSILET